MIGATAAGGPERQSFRLSDHLDFLATLGYLPAERAAHLDEAIGRTLAVQGRYAVAGYELTCPDETARARLLASTALSAARRVFGTMTTPVEREAFLIALGHSDERVPDAATPGSRVGQPLAAYLSLCRRVRDVVALMATASPAAMPALVREAALFAEAAVWMVSVCERADAIRAARP